MKNNFVAKHMNTFNVSRREVNRYRQNKINPQWIDECDLDYTNEDDDKKKLKKEEAESLLNFLCYIIDIIFVKCYIKQT